MSAAGYAPEDYEPPSFPDAENNLKVQFLDAARNWERMDIYVPQKPADGRLPCVIIFYGGGWGGKVAGFKEEMRALLDRGYVVMLPDYVLGASQPVPLAVWDGAAAIRFVRANAERYRVDPERIGVWGYSAGGWLVQHLAPSDSRTLVEARGRGPGDAKPRVMLGWVPMIEPHPVLADQPIKVQAVVTDWGAGVLADGAKSRRDWLTPDDPPLLTCHNDPSGKFPPGPQALLDAGVPTEVAYLNVKNTHVPSMKSPGTDKAGQPTTWLGRILAFLDEYVKNPSQASAPEILPHGGAIAGSTQVVLRSVHARAEIHYTLDSSEPTAASAIYDGPITIKPGTTLKTVAIKEGLKPSRVATAPFTKANAPPPLITTKERVFITKKGESFSFSFQADSKLPLQWLIAGKLANAQDQSNPPRPVEWLAVDRNTGELSGKPQAAGVCPLIVAVNAKDGDTVLCDAVSVIVVVTE
ncbi:MAG: chitobiase/beta-hexosaminidase C-terminal domain-containing protein [Planctomycetota bacterium]|nr:chitobiase/beta-hexosaminidase C-terminal domain-containing protein [Planctomycetota bacterium]